MEPARSIIELFGGDTALARDLGLHRTRVAAWKSPRSNGTIPFRHVPTLLRLAKERGIRLSADDFLPRTEEAA